ncbi:MAG: glycoside hydrolase family 97 N-terminal domain-containing protein, partial [Planctomycetota bacterium]
MVRSALLRITVLLTLAGVLGTVRLRAADSYDVGSPGKVYRVHLELDRYGRVSYSATYRGKTVVRSSRLGLELDQTSALDRNFVVKEKSQKSRRGRIESRLGERASVEFSWNELSLLLEQKTT